MEEVERRFKIEIEGKTPILMNKFVGQNIDTKNMSDKEVAEIACYRNEKGNLYIPREWIIGMLITSASHLASKQRKRIESYVARRIWVEEKEIDLGITEYNIDKRMVRVQGKISSTCEICIRPRIDVWKAVFHVRTTLDKEYLLKLLIYGGREVGIGSNRKYGFGQFKVTNIIEEKV